MSSKILEQNLWFFSGDKRAAGVLHAPDNADDQIPGVLMCHGFTGNRMEQRYIFVRLARKLAEAGIGCLRFDYRGCGESEGLFKDHSVPDYIRDAQNALQILRNAPGIDEKHIGLLGYSLGGCVAAETSSRERGIKTVVLWSPVAHPEKLLDKKVEKDKIQSLISSRKKEKKFIEHDGWAIGKDFITTLGRLKPVERLSGFSGPVLLCHGMQDMVVEPEHSSSFMKARQRAGKPVKTLFLENSGHGYKPLLEDEKLLKTTVNWFQKNLLQER